MESSINKAITVSLVVAVYKSEPFLDKLITSLISQTYRNIEIILVDDESPDNSGLICDNFAKLDKRIKVIHQKNKGTCGARNTGISMSTGDYLMIIDGDDWLEDDCVEYMLSLISKTNASMAIADKVFTTRDRTQTVSDYVEIWSPEKAIENLMYPYMAIGPWSKLYNLNIIRQNDISFSVPWFGEGLFFATQNAQYSEAIAVGHRKVYNYRLNNANSGLSNYKVANGINALNNVYNIKNSLKINSSGINNAINWHLYTNHLFLVLQIIGSNSIESNKENYKKCISYVRKHWLKVLLKSKINSREKIKVLYSGIFTRTYIKMKIKKQKREFENDLANNQMID